jgi:hypothetical protein
MRARSVAAGMVYDFINVRTGRPWGETDRSWGEEHHAPTDTVKGMAMAMADGIDASVGISFI